MDSDAMFDEIQANIKTVSLTNSRKLGSTDLDKECDNYPAFGNIGRARRKSVDHVQAGQPPAKIQRTSGRTKTKGTGLSKKQKLDAEKAAKQAAVQANKIYRPGECMKYMSVELHPALSSTWYCADVPREVGAAGARVSLCPDLCDPALLMWSRTVQPALVASNGQMQLSSSRQQCGAALYVVEAREAARHVRARSLPEVLRAARAAAGCPVTLVVFGVKDYFSSTRKTNNSSAKVTEVEFELALTDLLVSADCDTYIANTPNELALFIVHMTKAIAEAPYKKAKSASDDHADFYMRGDNKKCVAVDKDGHGMSRLWQQMLAILPHSSLETARSICAKHKSPLQLYETLQTPDGITELAEIGVARAAVPGSKARRLGPEFARKLHTLFTADDGDMLIE